MLDVEALYARHRDALLGATEDEAAPWLFGIARNQLARYYRRGTIERRALRRLQLERPAVDEALADVLDAHAIREATT